MLLEESAALGESDGMAGGAAQTVDRRASGREQTVAHGDQSLVGRAEPGRGGNRLPSGFDSADDRVLDRDDAGVGITGDHRANGAGESRHRDGLDGMAPDLSDGGLGVGAAVTLKGDAHQRASGTGLMGSV